MKNEFKNIDWHRFNSAVDFYLRILDLSNHVEIEFVPKNLRRAADKESRAWGWCYQGDRLTYMVEIDRTLSVRNVLTVLAHELVHIKQYYTLKLRDDGEVTYWLDEPCTLDYDMQPWEIEAKAMETVMYKAFLHWEAK